ncbi:hypothetical protein EGM88_02770 [Aureibaculum marinum]|uniref:Uncharacterized protein n=1 Tax=Aureibaculum marinum TaxID=2487930 RepID=A0A3N4NV08_9FLAO|nr:hypothetical protein [Aureibaculum marinum]RPE00203.1 hypothetical protein EGM88_02770 [Aureibaculum marinum]
MSCKATTTENPLKKQTFNLKNCLEQNQCSIEIIPNTNLLIKQNESEILDVSVSKGDKIIIKYELKRVELPNTEDGHYRELVYFEIDKKNRQLFLTNKALQHVKMTFGRFCYCKNGGTGFFKVTNGKLKLIRNENELQINLNFKVGKIPQIITEINETITLIDK